MKVYNVAEHLPTRLRSLLPSEVVGGGLGTAPISTDTLTYPIWTIALSICINNPTLDLYTGQSGPRPQAFPVFCHQGLTTFPTILMERDYKLTFEEFFLAPWSLRRVTLSQTCLCRRVWWGQSVNSSRS